MKDKTEKNSISNKWKSVSIQKRIAFVICFDALLVLITIAFRCMHEMYGCSWMLSAYVTMMTTSYHFIMRIAVGQSVTVCYRNREFNLNSMLLKPRKFEESLFRKLKVRRWKRNAITAKPEQFDINTLTPDELIHNVAQAETVHWICMALSFLPLLLIIPYGAAWVFVITSTLACLMDFRYVIIQRYNLPQVIRYKRFKESRRRISYEQ